MNPSAVRYLAFVVAIYVAVFISAYFVFPRNILGAKIDLLPALFVYIGATSGIISVALLAMLAGIWFDTFSANPLGVSILPLFLVGAAVWANRHNLLNEHRFAQVSLGLMATAAAPVVSLFLLYVLGSRPLIGLASLWQWFVMSLVGALVAPVWFGLFARLNRALFYAPAGDGMLRGDRELVRGRS